MNYWLILSILLLGLTAQAFASSNCYTSCNSNGTTTTCSTSCD